MEFNSDEQRLIGEGDDQGCWGQHQQMRGDDGGNEALPQMSNVSIM